MTEFPAHWLPGQLLHTQRYTDGAIKFTLIEDQDKRDADGVYFDNSLDGQNFISWWYQSNRVEDGRYGPSRAAEAPRGETEHLQPRDSTIHLRKVGRRRVAT